MDVSVFKETLEISFTKLSYSVNGAGKERKTILHDVSGRFRSGRLAAILGPSGAGKTTLLNVLSGFKQRDVRGVIEVNGEPRVPTTFRRQSCYITQDMALLGNLTASETLLVAARLKLGPEHDNHRKRQMVAEILELLGLQKTADTRVSRMSGGERKRLSIGLELLTNPPFMFFDEPTSGLDSASSVLMVTHLKSLAVSGRAVVCTLHQPSSRIFAMLDDVLVLAQGQVLYCGPTDQLVPAFERAGFACPQYYNRADFVLEVASYERGDSLLQLIESSRSHHKEKTPRLYDDLLDCPGENDFMLPPSGSNSEDTAVTLEPFCKPSKYAVSCFKQFHILLRRSLLCTFRDLHLAQLRLATHLIVGLLLGTIYYGIGNDASKINSNAACIFFFIMFVFFSNSMPTVHSFPLEASVFLHEHLNNWYSLSSYFFGKLLSDVPLQILCPTSFLLLSYFLTAQPADVCRVLMLWMVCMLLTILAQTMGLVAGAACDMQSGVFILAASSIPMFLFSGFFIRLSDIPVYLKWLSYISYFRFAFQSSIVALYGFNRPPLVCSVPFCAFKQPRKFLKELDMADEAGFWCCVAGLVTWIILLQMALYVALRWRLHKAR
ncbi:ATP-binding cassette sub-family G member 1 isoform X1 [Anabrus simplex]|uniref:ATP-binding cassette sub-family G member 1 isoform X1 n=1 Tax=Anabrus simplex TaxID=316456 RepID=UPI0035A30080